MSLFRKKPTMPHAFEPQDRYGGLSEVDLNRLGTYNAERARGIMHTPEWQAKMADMQARFDAGERERFLSQLPERQREQYLRREGGQQ